MDRASAVLIRQHVLSPRGAVIGALVVGLGAYYAVSEQLWDASTWWDLAFLALLLIPAVFALVVLGLPLRRAKGLLAVALAFAVLAVVLEAADLAAAANFAKLAAATGIGFWFLEWFERASWVVLVACLVPLVDAVSVWRGPTRHIVEERREVFTALSFAFPVPGEPASANLGLPDLLFFALFLAAAARFGLRVWWTWVAMTASFGLTLLLATVTDAIGLPALPLLCIAFLAVNADLLWRDLRQRPA